MVRSVSIMILCMVIILCGCSHQNIKSNSENEGSARITFSIMEDTIDDEMMSEIKDVLLERLEDLGFTEASILEKNNKELVVYIAPLKEDIRVIADIISRPNELMIFDPEGQIIVSNKDIKQATVNSDEKSIDIELLPDSAKKFGSITELLLGKKVTLLLDDNELARLTVAHPIEDGKFVVPGTSTLKEAEILATVLTSGKILPLTLKVVSVEEME